jgi:hypothetical protein
MEGDTEDMTHLNDLSCILTLTAGQDVKLSSFVIKSDSCGRWSEKDHYGLD